MSERTNQGKISRRDALKYIGKVVAVTAVTIIFPACNRNSQKWGSESSENPESSVVPQENTADGPTPQPAEEVLNTSDARTSIFTQDDEAKALESVENTSASDRQSIFADTPDSEERKAGTEGALFIVELKTDIPETSYVARYDIEFNSKAGVFALQYGRPGGWGGLSRAQTVEQVISISEERAAETSSVLQKKLSVLINPNVTGGNPMAENNEEFLKELIHEAGKKGHFVMIDIGTGTHEPVARAKEIIDKYMISPNVFFDVDLEHTHYGGRDGYMAASEINQISSYYFEKRAEFAKAGVNGFNEDNQGGIFAFYIFQNKKAVTDPENLTMVYENGVVVPINDGYGSYAAKQASVDQMREILGTGNYGVMEFQRTHPNKYDTDSWQTLFKENSDALIFASQ